MADLLFEIETPLGFRVRTTVGWWQVIVTVKHPTMAGREDDVRALLGSPDEVRRSRNDPDVYVFYKLERPGRWICAVTRRLDDREGFLITAYPADAVKIGETIWSN